jgi:hypothetical protein
MKQNNYNSCNKIEKEMAYERTTKKWKRHTRSDKKMMKDLWRKRKVQRREMKRHPTP